MARCLFFAFFVLLSVSFNVQAAEEALLIVELESGKLVASQGDIRAAYSPCSTFKVPLALMGFDRKILFSPQKPAWSYEETYADPRTEVHKTITPASWLAESAVWYSQLLTLKMTEPVFKKYVDGFHYGNMDISGDIGKNNGLLRSWLMSSLRISVEGQTAFLRDMLRCRLPVSVEATEMTKSVMPVFSAPGGWTLYGKTGSGPRLEGKGSALGWFVGWGVKGGQTLVFAYFKKDGSNGPQAREALLGKWAKYVNR